MQPACLPQAYHNILLKYISFQQHNSSTACWIRTIPKEDEQKLTWWVNGQDMTKAIGFILIWGATNMRGGGCYWPMGREQWTKAKAVCFLCWAMLLLSNDMAYTLLGISLYVFTNIPIIYIYRDRWNPCGPFVPKKVKRPLLQVLKFVKNISGVNLHRPLPWHAVQCEAILSAWCCLNTKEGIFLTGARTHKKGAGSRRGTFGSMIRK